MNKQARVAMGTEVLTAPADRGYLKGDEILACGEAGITTFIVKPLTFADINSKADGRVRRWEQGSN
jgi:hypothetical protein